MSDEPIFSESWHRVAKQRVWLRASVQVRMQFFRGEKWFILEDSFNNQFYRFRAPVYSFLGRLRPDKTVEQAWTECLEADPDNSPGQPEVIRLLSQLYQSNLLQSDLPPDSARLFERRRKRTEQQTRATLSNIFFLKFPVWDPDNFLNKCLPVLRPFFNWFGAAVWLAVTGTALKIVADNWTLVRSQSQGILSPGNFILLYAGLVATKAVHEFGHAFACKRFGGEVHKIGIMLMMFSPVPYVDATASWSFRSRARRVFVALAGVINELFFAALATFVWANTGSGTVNSIAYNIMVVASVSTLVFNLNPFLRFDGYYILSDLVDTPNLAKKGTDEITHLFEKYVCGLKKSLGPAQSNQEAFWLTSFSLISVCYRAFLFFSIILFVADRFLGLGLILAAVFLIQWSIVPVWKFVIYLTTEQRLERVRPRASGITAAAAAVVLAFLAFVPFPDAFRAPGVLESTPYAKIFNSSAGYIEEVYSVSGTLVHSGDPLVRMKSPELDLMIASSVAEREETLALQRHAMETLTSGIRPVNSRLIAVEKRLDTLRQQKENLLVRSRIDGIWASPTGSEMKWSFAKRGTLLGQVIPGEQYQFSAVVSQDDANRLFEKDTIGKATVRLYGQAGIPIPVRDSRIIPVQQNILPSAALGWRAGGEVEVSSSDPQGTTTAEPFFQVLANVEPTPGARLLHNRSGVIRFKLPPRPLLFQWWRIARQVMQKRYHL